MKFELGNQVRIGGRTMLRPNFSLVGLTGRVVSSRHDAPPGTVAVWVDWHEHGYEDTENLPPVVNVPGQHLEIVDPLSEKQSEITDPETPETNGEDKHNPFRLI